MANRFLNNIKINDEYTLPSADGTANQVVTTDGAGQLGFVDQSTLNAGNAEHVVIYAKNTSGSQIDKGTPVYITGTVGATDTVAIAPADAGNSAKMPAVGILDDTLINNAFGYVITGGFMDNITTDPIDGDQPASNDTVYVKVGGGLTLTKPTGPTGLIQNIAKVGKVSGGNSGSLIVSSILRTNDVPNLTTGKIWVGSNTNTTESTVVHLDETNGRMGIGTVPVLATLEVSGNIQASSFKTLDVTYGRFVNDAYIHANSGSDIVLGGGIGGYQNDVVISGGVIKASSTGNHYFVNSNVGIGKTNPSFNLDVTGNAGIRVSSGTDLPLRVLSTDATCGIELADSSQAYYILTTGSDFRIRDNTGGNVDRLTIEGTTGNVGIGTTSPSTNLEISGGAQLLTLRTSYTSDSSQKGAVLWKDVTDITGAIDTRYNGTTVDMHFGSLYSSGYNTTSRMVIKGNGNVGIGTTNPQEKLEVDGNVEAINFIGNGSQLTNVDAETLDGLNSTDFVRSTGSVSETVTGNKILTGITTLNNKTIIRKPSSNSINGFNAFEHYYITGQSLNYWGTLRSSSNNAFTYGVKIDETASDQYLSSVNNVNWIRSSLETGNVFEYKSLGATNAPVDSVVNLISRFKIDASTGDVGIGTTSPSSKLQVDGGVQMADDTDAASASKVGTLRYRTSGNNSYVDMCMQTGASTYEWVNIVQNNW